MIICSSRSSQAS